MRRHLAVLLVLACCAPSDARKLAQTGDAQVCMRCKLANRLCKGPDTGWVSAAGPSFCTPKLLHGG